MYLLLCYSAVKEVSFTSTIGRSGSWVAFACYDGVYELPDLAIKVLARSCREMLGNETEMK
jgi:hypothetical protein